MGRLVRVELENFKSYRGHQVIGPFHSFTSVIGPNGSGKSNLMDAVSFVLGIKSAQLRSSQLKDLIYRGHAMRENNPEDEEGDQQAEEVEYMNSQNPKKAWVMAVYEDDQGTEIRFTRSVTVTGASEYRLNNRVVTYANYNSALEEQNILVKARNFLVFQGDVEAIASQSPKDLTKLIEKISGYANILSPSRVDILLPFESFNYPLRTPFVSRSSDLKEEYDQLKAQQERATENSAFNFNKKRGINAEIKQYQEQKAEADRFEQLQDERQNIITTHLLWKLFHTERNIQLREKNIEDLNEQVQTVQDEQKELDTRLHTAKKEQAQLHKENLRHEKAIKRKEKEVDEKRPYFVSLEEKITHTTKKVKNASDNKEKVQKDCDVKSTKVENLRNELASVVKAATKFEKNQAASTKRKGPVLGPNELAEYTKLKEEVNVKTMTEQQRLENLKRQEKTEREACARISEKTEELQRSNQQLCEEETAQTELKEKITASIAQLSTNLNNAKRELDTVIADKGRIDQQETELNEKLAETLNRLAQAKTDKHESERNAKKKETLETLKRIYPGVHGRIVDLCKPTQRKYDIAVSIVLGRHMDAVVVDEEKTARECIQYMRDQRAGMATFIPLDTIIVKPINDRYRSLASGARLAIDVIQYEPALDRALHYACGNALICDTMEIAKDICYRRGQEVKAVTLDGTIIHKSGNMTGGQSGITLNAQRWEEKEIDALKKVRDTYISQLNELGRSKRRGNVEEQLASQIMGLEQQLTFQREELNATKRKLAAAKQEQRHFAKKSAELTPKSENAMAVLLALEKSIEELDGNIQKVVDSVFQDFCRRIKVANIREYEEQELKVAQEQAEMKLKFANQKSRLENQLTFEMQQLEATEARLEKLKETIVSEGETLASLEDEKESHLQGNAAITREIKSLRENVMSARRTYDEKTENVNRLRREVQKCLKQTDQLMKSIASMESEIERLNAERSSIFRKCKLEEIALPLTRGTLDDVTLDDANSIAHPGQREDPDAMDIDSEETPQSRYLGTGASQSQRSMRSTDWTIEVDFSELEEEQRENGGQDMDAEFQEEIKNLTADIDKLAPNMRAVDRLDGVEQRLRTTEEEFENARKESRTAKEKFNAVKQERYERFHAAYTHIVEKIDQTYKDLTKSRAFPLGGTAYLSLENNEEPYLDGIKYHAMPPMKRFRDMEQLSGGEKTVAALALLFAIHSYQPSPFFVLDEVDAALDNTNVGKVANYIREHASDTFQFIVISLKSTLYERAEALVGIYRDQDVNSSRVLTLKLDEYEE